MAHELPRVEDKEGGCEASGVAENPQGSRQGVDGGVELSQGNNTPGVTELSRGNKNPGVTTVGAGAPREDGQGWRRDKNPPTTRSTREKRNGGGDD